MNKNQIIEIFEKIDGDTVSIIEMHKILGVLIAYLLDQPNAFSEICTFEAVEKLKMNGATDSEIVSFTLNMDADDVSEIEPTIIFNNGVGYSLRIFKHDDYEQYNSEYVN